MSEERRPVLILGVLIVLLVVLYGAWQWTARSSSDMPSISPVAPSGSSMPYPGPSDGRPGPPGGGPGMMGSGKGGFRAR